MLSNGTAELILYFLTDGHPNNGITIFKNDLKDWTSFTLSASGAANTYDSSGTWKAYITLNANQDYIIADFDMFKMSIEGQNGSTIILKR